MAWVPTSGYFREQAGLRSRESVLHSFHSHCCPGYVLGEFEIGVDVKNSNKLKLSLQLGLRAKPSCGSLAIDPCLRFDVLFEIRFEESQTYRFREASSVRPTAQLAYLSSEGDMGCTFDDEKIFASLGTAFKRDYLGAYISELPTGPIGRGAVARAGDMHRRRASVCPTLCGKSVALAFALRRYGNNAFNPWIG